MSIKNNLDDIVNIGIEIGTPASGAESFSNALIVVSGPQNAVEKKMSGAAVISAANELSEYGYDSEEPAYIAASVAFAQNPAPTELYVIVRNMTGDVHEPLADTLNRALDKSGWYGIVLEDTFSSVDEIESVMKWAEANNKLFGFTITDINDIPKATNYFRGYGMYAGGVPDVEEQPKENMYAALALMVKCFGYTPGSETWALKTLSAISPSRLTASEKNTLEAANITYFTTYAGKNITNADGGKVLGNEWIDTIRFRDWLKNDMQLRILNLLVLNPKLPFTDGGITAVQAMMEESLKSGQDAGGIAQTEYDDEDNEIPGYATYVPKSLSLTDTQKASRKLPNCTFSARLAGAIQAVTISGNLKY